jgi:hypothetical protein
MMGGERRNLIPEHSDSGSATHSLAEGIDGGGSWVHTLTLVSLRPCHGTVGQLGISACLQPHCGGYEYTP